MHPIRMLPPHEFSRYRDHLLRLGPNDRRLRFGAPVPDQGIVDFVRTINPIETRVLVHFGPDLEIVGAVQVSVATASDTAEFAFSVEQPFRHRGVGWALMERALLWAQNRGVRRACVYCLAENHAMRRLARKAGMTLCVEGGECEAWVDIPHATPLTLWKELAAENVAFLDVSLKINHSLWGRGRFSPAL